MLAQAGLGSRRACEEFILQGRVTINGEVVRELGTRVDASKDEVAVDGEKFKQERTVYLAVYKPKGYVSTNHDPSGRPRVIDLVPNIPQRVYPIGRLDEDSAGLILLTNDGDLANQLAHPKFGVEKVYRVLVAGTPTEEVLQRLTEGVWLAEGKARAKRARIAGKQGQATQIEMVLAEGKNREVRRMLAKLGHKVMSLTRVAVGPVSIKGLKPGDHRPLSAPEIDLLRRAASGEDVRPSLPGSKARRPIAADSGPPRGRQPGGPRRPHAQAIEPPQLHGPRPGRPPLPTPQGGVGGGESRPSRPLQPPQGLGGIGAPRPSRPLPPPQGSREDGPPRLNRPPLSAPSGGGPRRISPPTGSRMPLPPPSGQGGGGPRSRPAGRPPAPVIRPRIVLGLDDDRPARDNEPQADSGAEAEISRPRPKRRARPVAKPRRRPGGGED